MPKPTKTELKKYQDILKLQLATLKGDVGSMRDEALRASDQDASVEPSSTMSHFLGFSVWLTMLSSVRRAYSASSRHGVIRR